MPIPLVLVSNPVAASASTLPLERPRQDYEEITRRLRGELCCARRRHKARYRLLHQIERRLKLSLSSTLIATRHAAEYNAILSTSERVAIPVAALSYLKRYSIPHIVIAHKLSSGLKTHLFHTWPVHKRFDHVITVCRAQAEYAVQHLGFHPNQVDFVHDKIDHHFFRPQQGEPVGDYILAVGREQRDYKTLARALDGTGLSLVVLANSLWSPDNPVDTETAVNVTFITDHLSYRDLRTLYARARLVVVPLFPVDYAAGVNGLLEAMAMAKPVIVTRTLGIEEYVVSGETGVWVEPENVAHLRDRILSLWHCPKQQALLATNARQAVVQSMNMDIYVNNVVRITQQAIAAHYHTPNPAHNISTP